MRRFTVFFVLAALSWSLAGCGGTDKPTAPGGANTPKAPDVPKDGP